MAEKNEGFTKVNNKILDALVRAKLSPAMLTAFLYIIRMTDGFNRSECQISIKYLASVTGYSRQAMTNAIHDLEQKGMIRVGFRQSGRPAQMKINDPTYWDQDI